VGAITDYVFKDESRLGDALGIVAPSLYLIGICIIIIAIKPYAKIMSDQDALEADVAAQ
jgi:hypothetical protein